PTARDRRRLRPGVAALQPLPPARAAAPRPHLHAGKLGLVRRPDAPSTGERHHRARGQGDRALSGISFLRPGRIKLARGGLAMKRLAWLGAAALAATAAAGADELQRNFAGSIQADYMAVPTEDVARKIAFDGATIELSMKLAIDFGPNTSANVKVCYACHGFEVGMAFF